MAKPIKSPKLALVADTGISATDLITSDGRVGVTPISGKDAIWYQTSLDGGAFGAWVKATTLTLPTPVGDGAWLINVEERTSKGAKVAGATLAFTLDTSADAGAPATLSTADALINAADRSATSWTLAGLDADASATVTLSDGTHQITRNVATDGMLTVDLSGFNDGLVTTSLHITDKAGNVRDAAGATMLIDSLAAAPAVVLVADTGASASDHVTRDARLDVSGLEAGAGVQYSIDGGAWGTVYAAHEGAQTVAVRQVDAAGNLSPATTLALTLDTTAPLPGDDAATFGAGGTLNIAVLVNDNNGGQIATAGDISGFTIAAHGSLVLEADGSFTYTPDAGYSGSDSFQYTLTDLAGNSASATVSLTVTDSTQLPPTVDAPLKAWAPEGGGPISVYALQNAWDANGDPLTVVGVPAVLPAGVSFDVTSATFGFDPALAGGSGASVGYGVSDGFATTMTSVSFVTGTSPFTPFDAAQHGLTSLVGALVPASGGVEVDPGSIALTAGSSSVNFYAPTGTPLGISAGLLLTSGTTPAPLNTMTWFGQDNTMPGSPLLDAVVNTVFHTQPGSFDATLLSFDFQLSDPSSTSVSFDLVFGSDEFPEWLDQFVDCAVVLVNGVNVALFGHDPLHPLSVITPNLSAGYFIDNAAGALPIEYDGVSHALKIVAPAIPGATNTLTIGIGDTGDHIYDSGLFIANLKASDAPGSGVVIPVTPPPPTGGANGSSCTGSDRDEYFEMTAGDDTVHAGGGDDIVLGADGADQLFGEAGEDALAGGNGADLLDGGLGEDELIGGAGADQLTGGDGADSFVFKSPAQWAASGLDQVLDFGAGPGRNGNPLVDAIDLHDGSLGATGDVLLFALQRLAALPGYVADPALAAPASEHYATLPASSLVNGSSADQSWAQFVFDATSGRLAFDPDGSGSAAALDIALIGIAAGAATLLPTDIVVVG